MRAAVDVGPYGVADSRRAATHPKNKTAARFLRMGAIGLGVRAPPVADEARMTRKKITSLGSKPCFATEATIFSTGRGPMRRRNRSIEKGAYDAVRPNFIFEGF